MESRDGIPFKQPMTRMRETIQIIKALLAGEDVNFSGKLFKLTGASMGAATPKTKVPIYIAALGPQMLEMVGELADGVLMNWTAVDYLAEASPVVWYLSLCALPLQERQIAVPQQLKRLQRRNQPNQGGLPLGSAELYYSGDIEAMGRFANPLYERRILPAPTPR